MKNLALLCGLCLLLAACHKDHTPPAEEQAATEVPVEMKMVVHKNMPAHDTRAIDAAAENTVQTVDILAFEIQGTNETFSYSAIGTISSSDSTSVQSFTVPLHVASYQQRIVVLTNARTQVGSLLGSSNWQGADKATMLAKLEVLLPSGSDRWDANSQTDYTAMPMWGESAAETISVTTQSLSTNIYLMRMIARIDVKLDTTVSGLTDSFKLKSVNLYNTNAGGLVVPTASNVTTTTQNGSTYLEATAPSVPTELQPYTERHLGPIAYSDFTSPGVTDVSMIGAIYTFETAAASDDTQATCLVVGGVYGTDTAPTYYRVDFFASGSQTRLNILRNYQYVVNITNVAGSGHATVDEAFRSKSVNMTVQILSWNQTSLGNIAFNGEHTLAVSKNTITLFSDAYTAATATGDNTLTVYTDYTAVSTGDTSGWQVGSIVNASDGTTPVTWLSMSPTSGAANATTSATITCSQNTTGAARSAIIWVTAGNLKYPIHVTQGIYPSISLTITDGSGNPVTKMVWSAAAGVQPAAQTLVVKGSPQGLLLNVVSTQASDTADFPSPSSNPPVTDGAPYTGRITGGQSTYTIQPPALTAAELAANPFLEKSSKVDYTISNGNTSITKSVVLTQLWYNLVTSALPNYPLNGTTNTFNVRSNAGWTIKSATQNLNTTTAMAKTPALLNPQTGDNLVAGTTGGYKTTAGGGDPIKFTTTNTGYWGWIDVVFTNNNTPSRFSDITQRILIPARAIGIYGLAGNTDVRYNVWNASSTGQDDAAMVLAQTNFGLTSSSKVIIMPGMFSGVSNSSAAVTTAMVGNTTPYDVVFFESCTWGDDVSSYINTNLLQKGKTVVMFCEDGNTVHSMVNAVLGSTVGNACAYMGGLNGNGAVYQFSGTNDPVLNNVFGDLRNAYWGNDGASGCVVWGLPSNGVVVYSYATNQSGTTSNVPSGVPSGSTMANGVTAFRLTSVPLIIFCDGGFAGNNGSGDTNATAWPSRVDSTSKLPVVKPNYGGSSNRSVSNSILIANILAWVAARNPAS